MTVDRTRLRDLLADEAAGFTERHPRSQALHERARRSLLDGVPMNWMVKWAGPFPLFLESASGAHATCVDGHDYVDLCLGDTGAMAGHGPAPTIAAVEAQLRRGITTMLPTEDAAWAGEELARRFGLPLWQFTLTATDANRFALRLAREITGRPLVAVHEWCYHGTVDESFAVLHDGGVVARRGNIGPPVDPARTTRVVPYNDLEALEAALADGQVAALLIEPALTNVGIVLPEPGYLQGVRDITRRHGTVLIHDETHTICAGPGGVTGALSLEPDVLVIGKTIGGGIPAGTYGLSAEVAARVRAAVAVEDSDVGGIGGTLAGYALSLAAIRATLGEVLTEAAFERMMPLAERWERGVADAIARHGAPWSVTRLGARAEYHFMPLPPRNGADQVAHADPELERLLHLWAMNRGVLMTPFHNMALMSPATTEADVDRHSTAFDEALAALF
ncbi:MAG TPA: aspartate aminotransferase family protein [Candidatus Deferrimicrobiaceae bacterium]|nr:aspartate aminotransferase family protein [Candidatus Deferrimicrobiaceae bacterium]